MTEHLHDETIQKLAAKGVSNVKIGEQIGKGREYVRVRRAALNLPASRHNGGRQGQGGAESELVNPDGSAEYVRQSDTPWGLEDFENFLRERGQDPEKVTFGYGWTTNPNGGVWNKLINVRPIGGELGVNMEGLTELIRGWHPTVGAPSIAAEPEGFIVGLADWQLGKSVDGNGTAGTIERLHASLEGTVRQVEKLRSEGRNLRTLHLANLGDHVENVAGSYESQTYEVDLNLRDQIEAALEMNLLWIRTLAPMFERVIYTASLCNHAQLSRGRGKSNITDDADNATGLIASLVKQMCALTPHLDHVDVRVPRSEMIVPLEVEGVHIATAHGHKITGGEEAWIAKQSQRLVHEQRFIPDLWLLAHRHSLSVEDYGPYPRIQVTTVDPGSKWFTDSTGKYSRPGTTIFTVQKGRPGVWDDLKVV